MPDQPSILAPIFDAAIAKLNAQDFKAYDEEVDSCAYRHNGGACLFGHMISDEHYQTSFDSSRDGKNPAMHAGVPSVRKALRLSTGVDFTTVLSKYDLSQIQAVHDDLWQPGMDLKQVIIEQTPHLAAKIWGDAILPEGQQP